MTNAESKIDEAEIWLFVVELIREVRSRLASAVGVDRIQLVRDLVRRVRHELAVLHDRGAVACRLLMALIEDLLA